MGVSGDVAYSGAPAWRTSMTAGTWAQVGTAMTTVDPEDDPAVNPNFPGLAPWRNSSGGGDILRVYSSWCGASFKQSNGRLAVHGGGHDDYAGNELYEFVSRVESPYWVRRINPTGAIGNTGTLDDGLEATGKYFDGRPRSSHTYGNLVHVDDELWVMLNGSAFRSGNGARVGFKFSETTNDWVEFQNGLFPNSTASGTGIGSACVDPTRRRVYYWPGSNTNICYWDVDASTANLTGTSVNANAETHIVYVPGRDVIVALSRAYSGYVAVFDFERTMNPPFFLVPQPGTTGTPPSYTYAGGNMWYHNGVWVPSRGAIACWHGGTTIHWLTPPAAGTETTAAWAWSQETVDPSNTVTPSNPQSNGTYGRFWHDEELNVLGVVNAANQAPYFFALD